jgi:hypothetical protein
MTLDVSGTTGVPSRSDPLCMEHRYDQHLSGSYAHVSCGSCFEFDKFIIVWVRLSWSDLEWGVW